MSRIHDALRKAEPESSQAIPPPPSRPIHAAVSQALTAEPEPAVAAPSGDGNVSTVHSPAVTAVAQPDLERLEGFILQAPIIPFTPAPDALLVDPASPKNAPSEEFRSLRTRLNHLQRSQPLHTLVITSASPGEGKSFTACNLAMTQSQLSGKRVLLADFDFRRPSIDKIFGITGVPGITDYLLGKVGVQDIIHRLVDTNLYLMAAGGSVPNPLELLNLPECSALLEALRDHFDWVIVDSPPLLFAADGNLLATMADGTILVVRIGTTTYDSVTRAMQSLCENNVLGVVVNGADRGELYNKYSYYQNYYYEPRNRIETGSTAEQALEETADRT
jgi:receptor protein-tyrosine kinase